MKEIRFERKWIFDNQLFNQLEIKLRRSKFNFVKSFNERFVNSIYFDSNKLSLAQENLDGVYRKKKIRIRWYGDSLILKKPVLEIKKKIGFIVDKSKHPLDKFETLDISNSSNLNMISEYLNNNFNSNNKIYPTSLISYLRNYFVSPHNQIRATIDRKVASRKIYFDQILNKKFIMNSCILEFKYPTIQDSYVRKNLNISLRLVKNSKYINSIFKQPGRYIY